LEGGGLEPLESDGFELDDSFFDDSFFDEDGDEDEPPDSEDDVAPLTDAVDERESVMYQPLPLKTMPTG
jgi:hypothetical protein